MGKAYPEPHSDQLLSKDWLAVNSVGMEEDKEKTWRKKSTMARKWDHGEISPTSQCCPPPGSSSHEIRDLYSTCIAPEHQTTLNQGFYQMKMKLVSFLVSSVTRN